MKNKFSIHVLPKKFTLFGIQYEEGEAENIETHNIFPICRISLGLFFIVFEIIINRKKGEN